MPNERGPVGGAGELPFLLAKLRGIGEALRTTNIFRGREIMQLAGDIERAAKAPQGVPVELASLAVGDTAYLKARIVEMVEPNHRGIGVGVIVNAKGTVELPLWVDLAALTHALAAPPAPSGVAAPYDKSPIGTTRTIIVGPDHEDAARIYTPKGEINAYWVPEIEGRTAFVNIFIHGDLTTELEHLVQGTVNPSMAHISIGEAAAPKPINPDSAEFVAGDSYGMSRFFQQLERYLKTGTCECGEIVEFAAKLETKFHASAERVRELIAKWRSEGLLSRQYANELERALPSNTEDHGGKPAVDNSRCSLCGTRRFECRLKGEMRFGGCASTNCKDALHDFRLENPETMEKS